MFSAFQNGRGVVGDIPLTSSSNGGDFAPSSSINEISEFNTTENSGLHKNKSSTV